MTRQTVRQRLAERARLRVPCALQGCGYPAQKLGSLCESHDLANERTGHPLGTTIRFATVKPYLALTSRYIEQNRDHPAIALGLRWIFNTIHAPRVVDPYRRRNAKPREQHARWMNQLLKEDVHEEEVLAMVAAMCLLREREPRVFKSDRHFNAQLAIRVLRLAPAPFIETWKDGKGARQYHRIGVGVREILAQQINTNLGLLSLRIARVLAKALNNHNPYQPTTTPQAIARGSSKEQQT